MLCAKCGVAIHDDSLVCEYCGALIDIPGIEPASVESFAAPPLPPVVPPPTAEASQQTMPVVPPSVIEVSQKTEPLVMPSPVDEVPQQTTAPVVPQQRHYVPPMSAYQVLPPGAQEVAPVVSFGQWLGTFFLLLIPIVGFVLSLIWCFSDDVNPSKRNFARAYWIYSLIMIVMGIIFIGVVIFSVLNDFLPGGYFY
jgi:hypothetical protein